MAIVRLFQNAAATRKVQPRLDVVEFFRSQLDERCQLSWRSGVATKANLNSSVFRECLGLDYSRFETKEKLIDEKLLGNRNKIAHGQYLLIGFEEYASLHDEMSWIMQDFYTQVENAAFTGAYLRGHGVS